MGLKVVVNDKLSFDITVDQIDAADFLGLIEDATKFVRKNMVGGGNALSLPREWSKEDDKKLIELVESETPRNVIAEALGRELGATYTRITKLRKGGKLK